MPRYRQRFGFPFIVAVKAQRNRQAILNSLEQRAKHERATEMAIALSEVTAIARFRLDALIGPEKGAKLTLHVLDTVRGRPAADLAFTLYQLDGESRHRAVTGRTNPDGRAAQGTLPVGANLKIGLYEIVFEAGAYLIRQGEKAESLFFDQIPIRFHIADTTQPYHVPLILSGYGYSTYRGS